LPRAIGAHPGREDNSILLHCVEFTTKRCSVFDKTPKTDTPNITVASDAIFKTRADAEAAMNKLPSCNR
jgi:uncharacterized protein YfcZ (UPF0381/DUF406 family)